MNEPMFYLLILLEGVVIIALLIHLRKIDEHMDKMDEHIEKVDDLIGKLEREFER